MKEIEDCRRVFKGKRKLKKEREKIMDAKEGKGRIAKKKKGK